MKYDHREIEQKWQKKWQTEQLYQTSDAQDKPKYYVLDMFPYPSGSGLHVGHPKGYIATDILARQKMMEGFNVLHPMGWDAFGLPAENYALKNHEHPRISTRKNVETFKKQLEILGFSYDWSREINTTDPEFYQWTQWTFIKFFESYFDEKTGQAQPIQKLIEQQFGRGKTYQDLDQAQRAEIDDQRLAFEDFAPINWCPSCQTGLANEDLEDGKCERCGSEIQLKPMRQWKIRITKYADRLLEDLKLLSGWEDFIKTMQTNWIGKKVGINIDYKIEETPFEIKVFTTRPDTNFGATFVVTAPDSEWVKAHLEDFPAREKVLKYVEAALAKSVEERAAEGRKKTGVFTGWYANNPLTDEKMPIYVADFVLANFGTGSVVGVPGHDLRDFEFASEFKLPIKRVVMGEDGDQSEITRAEQVQEENGVMVNSGFLDGLNIHVATEKIMDHIVAAGYGQRTVNYRLQDWVFSRQRYWGEPIPIVHCEKCGAVAVPAKDLPVKLPEVEKYEPSGTGESPLATISEWVETKCPVCGGSARRETNTMPQWAGSSWYYLRYLDPKNQQALVDPAKEKYFMPVDFYVGGAEHATRHLIYARFWHKFLYDLGVVSTVEPFAQLKHVGLILAEDGRKMSKRWNNVINPDEIVARFGADSMRLYEMFMSPFSQASSWNTQGVSGVRKFLEKVWQLQDKLTPSTEIDSAYQTLLHQTIKKVGNDISAFKLNTAVSAMMILANKLSEFSLINRDDFAMFVQILAPFAPHVAEEMWANLGQKKSVFKSSWPKFSPELAQDEQVAIAVQINGKLRGEMMIDNALLDNEVLVVDAARRLEKVAAALEGREPKKTIYVPGRIVNFVV